MKQLLKRFIPESIKTYIRARRPRMGEGILPFQYYQSNHGASEFVVTKSTQAELFDGLPLPPKEYWQGYSTTAERFVSGGKKSVDDMFEIIKHAGCEVPDAPILDFGCGAGRMIRHLVSHASTREVWGVDVNATYMQWCINHLQPPLLFATTSLLHSLPFEDNFFGLVYAGSVFTHTEDLTSAWLAELRRVLRPKGLLFITIHDEACLAFHRDEQPNGPLWKQLEASDSYRNHREDYQAIVLGRRVMSNVWYKRDYFLTKYIRPLFDELSVTDRAYGGHQTAVLAEKRSGGTP